MHFLHALSSAARQRTRGDAVKFYVEDLERVARWLDPAQALSGSCWPPWDSMQGLPGVHGRDGPL